MKNTHILIFEHDVLKYPPILSVINFLFSINKKIVLIGYCQDKKFIDSFLLRGGEFHNIIENNTSDNIAMKLVNYINFKKDVREKLSKYSSKDIKVWFFGEQCIWLLHKLVYEYDCNLYLFEVPSFKVHLRYRLLSLSLQYKKVLQAATKVICCEYNRAHITKSFFDLSELPIIVPNKPNINEELIDYCFTKEFVSRIKGKKVILYQGIFNYPERRLDEVCEIMKFLSDDFILCLMGSENTYKSKLKSKYESNRIVFLPYISAPHHLAVTKVAYIGILVYNSESTNIKSTLNTLYCAPNKIYEYAEYGVPMISNDVPALSNVFEKYKCGECVDFKDVKEMVRKIIEIDSNYLFYSENSKVFSKECDLNKLYSNLV